MSDFEGSYSGVGYLVKVKGMDRYFRYTDESQAIKNIMADCNHYRDTNNVVYDGTVDVMLKKALSKYDALAKWIGVKNVVTDIRDAMVDVRDGVYQHTDVFIDLPDDAGYPADGAEGDGAFVTFEPLPGAQQETLPKSDQVAPGEDQEDVSKEAE